eukprot:gene2261-2784_t
MGLDIQNYFIFPKEWYQSPFSSNKYDESEFQKVVSFGLLQDKESHRLIFKDFQCFGRYYWPLVSDKETLELTTLFSCLMFFADDMLEENHLNKTKIKEFRELWLDGTMPPTPTPLDYFSLYIRETIKQLCVGREAMFERFTERTLFSLDYSIRFYDNESVEMSEYLVNRTMGSGWYMVNALTDVIYGKNIKTEYLYHQFYDKMAKIQHLIQCLHNDIFSLEKEIQLNQNYNAIILFQKKTNEPLSKSFERIWIPSIGSSRI